MSQTKSDQEILMSDPRLNRRYFLQHSSVAGAGLLIPALALASPQQEAAGKKDEAENIPPAEDLMREHGVLNRVLLIYDYPLHLPGAKQTFDGSLLASAADIIRHFVEEYHEK